MGVRKVKADPNFSLLDGVHKVGSCLINGEGSIKWCTDHALTGIHLEAPDQWQE